MSGDPNGLNMLERWRMINMCYHIVELNDRSDLIKCLLGNLDFSLYVHDRMTCEVFTDWSPETVTSVSCSRRH